MRHLFLILTAFLTFSAFSPEASAQSRREMARMADDFADLTSDVLRVAEREAGRRPGHLERRALQDLRQLERDAWDFADTLDRWSWRNLQDSYDQASRGFRDLTAYRYERDLFYDLEDCFEDLEDLARDYFRGHGGGGGDHGQMQSVQMTCISFWRLYRECPVPGVQQIERVEVVHNQSNTECEMGRSFGFRNDILWVNNGCRATFAVYYRR